MLLSVVRSSPWKLAMLVGLAMVFVVALPGSTEAASLNEVSKLLASDPQANDDFGYSVAVSGDIAVAGAWLEDAGGDRAGAAYVFQRNYDGADAWGQVTKLVASDAQPGAVVGWSVAISGDTVVVGASGESAEGLNAGAAYVFQRNEGGSDNWGEVKKLTASDAQAEEFFGWSVAVDGDTAVVAAAGEGTTGVNAGAAYVFERDEGGTDNWGEVARLLAFDAESDGQFGWSVAVSGDSAIVGAWAENAGGSHAGAAFVFQRDEGGADNWGEVTKLIASDAQAEDFFGYSVAVSGDTAVVGALGEDAGGSRAGAAYVFQRDQGGAGNWGEVQKLTASDAQAGDDFGHGVAISGDTAVVGAAEEDVGGSRAGAAYVFQRDEGGAGNWGEFAKLTASDAREFDLLGFSVAVSDNTAVVGAYAEDTGAGSAGAAYVFDLLGAKSTPTSAPPETQTPPATATPAPTSTPVSTATPDVSTGDANCDGTVNSIDAALVLQFSAALLGSLPCAASADVNDDGAISAIDGALILQFAAGLLPSLPPS